MGEVIKPRCECNFEFDELFVGAGMMGSPKGGDNPTPCFNCKTIFLSDIFKKKIECPKCNRKVEPYGGISDTGQEDIMVTPENLGEIINWLKELDERYELKGEKFKCPNCLKKELTFVNIGLWD